MSTVVYNNAIVSVEERETTINVDHYANVFHVYTTNKAAANMLKRQFPDYFELSKDKASATVNSVPVAFITKIHLSKMK